jgi:hypothetical protein
MLIVSLALFSASAIISGQCVALALTTRLNPPGQIVA